ncbi:transcriptional regulator, partial [Streptomyces hygroscopicus]
PVGAACAPLGGRVGGGGAHRPYRIADGVRIDVASPDHPAVLLPFSRAPAVVELRGFPAF